MKSDSMRLARAVTASAALAALAVAFTAASAAPAGDSGVRATAKPSAPIAISYEFAAEPSVGQPLDLTLSITAEGDMSAVSVTLTADDPLAMIDPIGRASLGSLAVGDKSVLAVTVLPLLDQTHYLNVSVTALVDGVEQTRSIAVPIRLSGVAARKSTNGSAGEVEGGVRSFEAIETIH